MDMHQANGALEFGVMNSLRTGNVFLDTLVCLMVPVLLKYICSGGSQLGGLLEKVIKLFHSKPQEITRQIEAQYFRNYWGITRDDEAKNHILQKALNVYFTNESCMECDCRYELVANPSKSTTASGYDSDDSDAETPDFEALEVEALMIGKLPPLGEAIEIQPGIYFKHEIQTQSENEDDKNNHRSLNMTSVIYIFTSKLPNADEKIDQIINGAYEQYRSQMKRRQQADKSRYMYIARYSQPRVQAAEGKDPSSTDASGCQYKRYTLSEEKTFDNLFFDEKASLLKMLDDFQTKSGKFAIKGFPNKIGLLLHGPPGTGKTSVIKAIAQYTGRHVVNISLSKIKTNQELMDMVFDLKFPVEGEDFPVKLAFDKIVFVMEDVDCASSIVKARSAEDPFEKEKKMQDKLESLMTTLPLSEASGLSSLKGPSLFSAPKFDKLNLSGILNVLDGVVDCPGRILIMTTNHPEKLDPALIRPGRINKKLLMGYLSGKQACEMIQHYFGVEMTKQQRQQIEDIWNNSGKTNYSPAEVEQWCAEFDEIEELIKHLYTFPSTAAAA